MTGVDYAMSYFALGKNRSTRFEEEVRRTIDAYLAGISPNDVAMLDAGTRRAEQHLAEMAAELDHINTRLDATFRKLDRAHSKARRA